MFSFFDKAIASFISPALVSVIGGWAAGFGVTGAVDLTTFLTMVLSGCVTFAVPGFGKTIAGFVVPAIVSGIMGIVHGIGITGAVDWKTAVTMLVSGLLTHLAVNKPKAA